jgi:hypothetical protein
VWEVKGVGSEGTFFGAWGGVGPVIHWRYPTGRPLPQARGSPHPTQGPAFFAFFWESLRNSPSAGPRLGLTRATIKLSLALPPPTSPVWRNQ